jgi:hypothetical protein
MRYCTHPSHTAPEFCVCEADELVREIERLRGIAQRMYDAHRNISFHSPKMRRGHCPTCDGYREALRPADETDDYRCTGCNSIDPYEHHSNCPNRASGKTDGGTCSK